jgi:hypothetical protein
VRCYNVIVKQEGGGIYKKYGAALSPVCHSVDDNIRALKQRSLRRDSKARQRLCIQHNVDAGSCNRFCSGKAINITYSECGFVALGIQYPLSIRRIVICGLSSSTIFCRNIS